uniref:Transmembrane domain-containing protein n=1 Tax=Spironucleus salmonicida TaxID=348837 RepID=V6LP33_9EUKA|eukprot:EST45476.1 Transmembrane domain-containing protein [Spironucleus salmonicida]
MRFAKKYIVKTFYSGLLAIHATAICLSTYDIASSISIYRVSRLTPEEGLSIRMGLVSPKKIYSAIFQFPIPGYFWIVLFTDRGCLYHSPNLEIPQLEYFVQILYNNDICMIESPSQVLFDKIFLGILAISSILLAFSAAGLALIWCFCIGFCTCREVRPKYKRIAG